MSHELLVQKGFTKRRATVPTVLIKYIKHQDCILHATSIFQNWLIIKFIYALIKLTYTWLFIILKILSLLIKL